MNGHISDIPSFLTLAEMQESDMILRSTHFHICPFDRDEDALRIDINEALRISGARVKDRGWVSDGYLINFKTEVDAFGFQLAYM